MKLTFSEEMRGQLENGRAFHFRARVLAPTLKAVMFAEPLGLEGDATLEGAVEGAPMSGSLVIGLPWRRRLEYDLSFKAGEHTYRFFGTKQVRYLRFPSTMTTLQGMVYCDGAELGRATLRFALKELPALMASVRLLSDGTAQPMLHP